MIWPNPITFCRAIWRAVCALFRLDPVLAPSEVMSQRLDKCSVCRYQEDSQCQLCTCFIEGKAALATETCPDGQWGPYIKRSGRAAGP